jgi:hypothetical protein
LTGSGVLPVALVVMALDRVMQTGTLENLS